ncbi:MAG: 50S ribosomal protein L22 [Candidatus Paceibacterota bacterium]
MQVTAQLNNLRISPRKVRLISGLIKGMDVNAAKFQLDHLVKKSARPIQKLLESAMSNAQSNFNLVKDNLYIKDILVNEGPKLHRYKAKGFGSVSPIEKKTSHIKITLDERVPGLKSSEQKPAKAEEVKEKPEEIKAEEQVRDIDMKEEKKPEIKKELGKKEGIVGKLGKKFFRRKAI